MTARTHDLAAVTALAVVGLTQHLPTMSLSTFLVALLANQLGGVTPDIDQPTAPFWRNLPVGGYVGKVVDKMLGGHRFITHSAIGLGLFGFLSYALLNFLHPVLGSINVHIVWWAFMIGMASHLIMDTFTKEGVPWLLPIPIKFGIPPVKKMRITTGKSTEKFLFLTILTFDIAYFWVHYDKVLDLLHSHIL